MSGQHSIVKSIVVVVCILRGSALVAQNHPCDRPEADGQLVEPGAPYALQFCAADADHLEAAIVTLDGVPADLVPLVARSAPSATGEILHEAQLVIRPSRGVHTLTAAGYHRTASGELRVGPTSPPFTFTAGDATAAPPRVPTGITIRGEL